MTFRFQFSGDLCRARLEWHLTQMRLAELAHISLREYQNLESGKISPRAEAFLRLVFALELGIENYREVMGFALPISVH